MSHDELEKLSVHLVNKAEEACADVDIDDLGESAGMVLVGDVYGMIVAQEDLPHAREVTKDGDSTDPDLQAIDPMNPFIR
jgi:hypothetical protein